MTQPAPPQISFTITLHPSVTMEQFNAVLKAVEQGLVTYQHLVAGVTANHIAPQTTQLSVVITADGISQEDFRLQVANVLKALPAEAFTWQLSDDPKK